VEGHLLMITSNHYDCYGALPERFYPAIRITQQRVRQMFNEIYHAGTLFFEHGPAQYKEAGACINHAHWHCLPKSLPLRHAIDKYVGQGQAATIDTLSRLYNDRQSYLYLEEGTSEGFAYPIRVLPCQFLREVVGSLIGHQNWGWQVSYSLDESKDVFRRTLNRLFPLADSLLLPTEVDR
jgi:hypothetical protein